MYRKREQFRKRLAVRIVVNFQRKIFVRFLANLFDTLGAGVLIRP